jgi:tRNA modification GTPase
LDVLAITSGRSTLDGAALVLACSAPDAPLPADHGLPPERTLVIATKADLGIHDARAELGVSTETGEGLDRLAGLVAERLGDVASGEPRQQRLLAACDGIMVALVARLPPDELLADDLRRSADLLGELIGATTPDDVLDAIFSRFCIGK